MEKKNEIPNIKDKNLEKVKENKKEAFSDSEIIPISNTKITSLG
jgi:hypothetical protein